ncbi:MAG: hypothetical protein QOC75_4387 [Pseudonocardiales bacterium]|nr:hypothetical protein [Pseudonocardiales bacterium]
MFDGVDAGLDSGADRVGPVGVRGDPQAGAAGLGDDDPELPGGELRFVHGGAARCQLPAAGHHLDQVGAGVDVAADLLPELGVAVAGQVDVTTEEPAVPAADGDGRPGGNDARAGAFAGGDGVAQVECGAVVAQVADGGDAGPEGRAGALRHSGEQLLGAGSLEGPDRIGAGVEREVDVAVDQSRQQRRAGEVVPAGVGGGVPFDLGPPPDGHDPPVPHQHRRVGQALAGRAVQQPVSADERIRHSRPQALPLVPIMESA